MKLERIVEWLDRTLNVAAFDDVSNNGLQIGRLPSAAPRGGRRAPAAIGTVAFAVDASVRAVEAAAKRGARLLVVHHGISWGGGVKRLTGGVYSVVRAALEANLAVYASHLPLDAHPVLGNNAQLAKLFGLRKTRPAFAYRGNVIGLVGACSSRRFAECLRSLGAGDRLADSRTIRQSNTPTIQQSNILLGICSGGAGDFAEEAKRLGCDVFLTGEAGWRDVVAAENCGMRMVCAGHYATEVFGVRALAKAMKRTLGLVTVDLTEELG